jgi:hypothetical protein
MSKFQNLKPKTYYKIISKDDYNGLYFWIDNLKYNKKDKLIEFKFFYSVFTMPRLEADLEIILNKPYNDLLYVRDKSDEWIVTEVENNWELYEIPDEELSKIQFLETKLFGSAKIKKAW